MREIKFRGKSVANDKWVYGGIVHYANHYGFTVDKWFITDDEGDNDEVRNNTIGQYTGLKDRDGTEIYEGDIVAINKELLGCYVIKYDENHAKFGMYINGYEQAGFNKVTMKAYEVIGNIYDNPELLEERTNEYRRNSEIHICHIEKT